MIVGVIARSDAVAEQVLERIGDAVGVGPVGVSVGACVGIAAWSALGPMRLTGFRDDAAVIGTWPKQHPGPHEPLPGDFAWVSREGTRLRLARARFAGRPLYWLRTGSVTVASSHLTAIGAAVGVELNVDHLLTRFDSRTFGSSPPLPFRGASTVRTNTVIDLDREGRDRAYIGPLAFGPELRLSEPDLARAVGTEFRSAIERQCQGLRRVAVMTGGGLDSSYLFAAAVANSRERGSAEAVALALDYGGPGDDRPYLADLCRHLSVEPCRATPASSAPYAGRERVVDAAIHATVPASMMLAAADLARDRRVECIFEGGGSELLFEPDGGVFADFLTRHPMRALHCAARFSGIVDVPPRVWRRLIVGPLARRILPQAVLGARWYARQWRRVREKPLGPSWAGPRLVTFLARARPYVRRTAIFGQRERVRQLASSDGLMAMREHASRWEVATGMPISFPYLDDEFVRFVARVPSSAIFAGARERGLLRESMAGLVPDRIRHRMDKARPYRAFAEAFAAMGGRSSVAELLTMRELERLEIVDSEKFLAAFARFADDPEARSQDWLTLWSAISAEAYVRWFRQFKADLASRGASLPLALEPS